MFFVPFLKFIKLMKRTTVAILEHMVTGPDHGFRSHEKAVEPIYSRIVPKLH